MTVGYPTDAATNAVQANIVAAKYNVYPVSLSRVKTFTPSMAQDVVHTFTNSTADPVSGIKVSLSLPAGWTASVTGSADGSRTIADPVAPGASVSTTFKVTSPAAPAAGYLAAKTEWSSAAAGKLNAESVSTRIRSAWPVKINEVQMSSTTNQFIELFNAGTTEVDISNWSLINTQSQWAPVKLVTIPTGAKIAPKSHYLLALSSSGLVAPASSGDAILLVRDAAGFAIGQQIDIGGESRKVTAVGSAAGALTTLFIPVSTGPWLDFPVGTTNFPVTSATAFVAGQKIGIDLGGNYEVATVTAVGTPATQTTLAAAAAAGASTLSVAANADLNAGDKLTVDTGARKEIVTVKSIGNRVTGGPAGGGRGRGPAAAGTVELTAPLKLDHMNGVDVSAPGTGITFTPATKFAHRSGDAIQALGTGITLDAPLAKNHTYGTPILNPQSTSEGYQAPPAPNLWFGATLSSRAGSLALMDPSGTIVVDAIIYGSQQSNSSANGTIVSPELATLEGEQTKGGCIVPVPQPGRGGGRGRGAAAPPAGTPAPARSAARTSDGVDTDSGCTDFQLQSATPGAPNKAS